MTTVPLTPPKMQFFDANGDPLAGGKIYAYQAGTSTPQDTYTSSTGGTPNANPVILDAAGKASIWLGTAAYKFVIKDSSDTIQDTVDNYTPFNAGAASSYSDSSFTLYDNADATKLLMFQLSGLTTGTTSVLTVPDGNGTLVTLAATQTLTNKTLTSPTITTPKYTAEATVASATTTDLASGSSNFVAISGTATVTSFGSNALTTNPIYKCRATGAFTLTHNASSLILPGGANITAASGDTFEAKYEGSGNWRINWYEKATGKAVITSTTSTDLPTGTLIQSLAATDATNTDLSTLIPNDDTIPQITEGTEIVTQAITPTSATSVIEIEASWYAAGAGSTLVTGALFVDATANALAAGTHVGGSVSLPTAGRVIHRETSGNTTARTYRLRVGPHTGTVRLNGTTSARLMGGVMKTYLIVREIKA